MDKNASAGKTFRQRAEQARESIRRTEAVYNPPGVSTDLLVNEAAGVAVIGTQWSGDGYGDDRIYLLRDGEKLKEVRRGSFYHGGRMFPTGIADDGRSFTYASHQGDGRLSSYVFDIETRASRLKEERA